MTDLSQGSHSLVVYASDIAGNLGLSKVENFTFSKQTEVTAIPTAIIILVIAILVLVVAVFLRKRSMKPAVQSTDESK